MEIISSFVTVSEAKKNSKVDLEALTASKKTKAKQLKGGKLIKK